MSPTPPPTLPPKPPSASGWRGFFALQGTGMGPVERAFFDEQHLHTIGTIRVSMILGLMLWIIQSGMEYTGGVAEPAQVDVLWHVAIGIFLTVIYLLYRPPLSSMKGHLLLSAYAGAMSIGLMIALGFASARWPYALASFVILTVAVVALWTRMRWMFLGLAPLGLPIVYACVEGLFPAAMTPLIGFYVVIAAMFGLLLRSGRTRPAFEVFVLRQHLMRKALLDPLTKVWNRAGWEARLDAVEDDDEVDHAHACVLFIDLDHFKLVNDKHGHEQGDIVLRKVAQAIADTLRSDDVFARIGGEEFSAWLSGADAEQGWQVAERIRRRVAALKFPDTITVSIGLACVAAGEDVRAAVRRADAALFMAKEHGRNQVWKWDDTQETSPPPED